MRRFFERLYAVPPPEKRRPMFGLLVTLLDGFKEGPVDTYIYYRMLVNCMIAGYALSFLFWISYVWDINFDFGLFKIDVPYDEPTKYLSRNYPYKMFAANFLVFIPFYYKKFTFNIDLTNYEALSSNQKLKGKNPGETIWAMRFVTIMILMVIIPSPAISNGLLYNRQDTYGTFLFLLVAFPMMAAILSRGLLYAFIVTKNQKLKIKCGKEKQL